MKTNLCGDSGDEDKFAAKMGMKMNLCWENGDEDKPLWGQWG